MSLDAGRGRVRSAGSAPIMLPMPVGRLTTAAALCLAIAWMAVDALPSCELGALHLLPFLVLVTLLWRRRYPGERRLEALRLSVRPRRRRRPQSDTRSPARPARAVMARGGDLLGRAVAVRPPPRLEVLTH